MFAFIIKIFLKYTGINVYIIFYLKYFVRNNMYLYIKAECKLTSFTTMKHMNIYI